MNVFNDYEYYYQQQLQLQQQQHLQQMNNMDRIPYKLNEVLYPDHNKVMHSNEYSNAPYQVYNLDASGAQNNGFYLYKPIESVTEYITELEPNLNHEIETILKKNSEVWAAYESGRFDVSDSIENGVRKIVLKEKGTDGGNESEFTIRKYRVTLTNRRRRQKKSDDHVLLVSFSNSSLNNQPQQQQQQNNTSNHQTNRVTRTSSNHKSNNHHNSMMTHHHTQSIHKTPTPAILVGNSAPADSDRFSSLDNYTDHHHLHHHHHTSMMENNISENAYLSGPGSELINKIINGDDSFEFSDDDPHSIAAKLSYPETLMRNSQHTSTTATTKPTMSSQSQQSQLLHQQQQENDDEEEEPEEDEEEVEEGEQEEVEEEESQPDSFDDEYIETYAPTHKQSLVSAADMVTLSPTGSRRSDSRRTVDQYTPSSRYSQVSPRPSNNTNSNNIHVNETYGQSRLSQNGSETTSYSQSNNTPVNNHRNHNQSSEYLQTTTGTVTSSRMSGQTRPSKTSYSHHHHQQQQQQQQQTPQPTIRDTPISMAAQSASISLRDLNGGPITPSRLSTLNYTSDEVVKTPVTASSIRAGSRGSSTAAIHPHHHHLHHHSHSNYDQTINQDTQSIGPGSLAGGSLFGGFIPSNFETESQIQNDKSAFSEYTLSRNEAEQSVTNQILKDLMDMAEADRKSQHSLNRQNSANSLIRVSPTKSRVITRQSGGQQTRISPRHSTVQSASPPPIPVELRLGSINSRNSSNLNSTTPQIDTTGNLSSRLSHLHGGSRLSGVKASPRQSAHLGKTPNQIRVDSRQSVNGQLVSNQILQDLLDLADADARRSQTSIRIGSRQSGNI